jgi:hypothetical protein
LRQEWRVFLAANDYHFITRWHLPDTNLEEVSEILGNAQDLVRWWPSVYLAVQELDPGDPDTGVGTEIGLYTKGWLPYTLRWQFRVTESNPPHGFRLEASGDFIGQGIWTFEPEGGGVLATYDWKIRAGKPLLQRLSFLLKPVFSANHIWAMEMGERSLLLELRRRRAANGGEAARVPPPPGPTFRWNIRK